MKIIVPPTPPAMKPTIRRIMPQSMWEVHFAPAMAITPAMRRIMPLNNASRPLMRETVKMPTKGLLKMEIKPNMTRITPPITAKIQPIAAKRLKLVHLHKITLNQP